jgi:hypothetical protein
MSRWAQSVIAAAVTIGTSAMPAIADTVFVSNMSLPYYEIVDLAGGRIGRQTGVYAGQQVLTANNGSTYDPLRTYTLDAWCVDFDHDIYIGGNSINYTLSTLTDDHLGATAATSNPVSSATAKELAGVVAYGNGLMQASPSKLISAAVQVALWNIEYGSTYAGSDTALGAEISRLMALAPSLSATNGVLLDSFDAGGITYRNQSLLFNAYPSGPTSASSAVVAEPGTAALLGAAVVGFLLSLRCGRVRAPRI